MFLCTGNSCRSQMAEGILKRLGGDLVEVHSAGLEAHGLNPRAVKVMAEVGIDIAHYQSKTIDPELLGAMDYVITLCSDAETRCPTTPPRIKRLHFPFDDPSLADGNEEEIMVIFRRVRDKITVRLKQFLIDERLL